jgi:hypothetical protein
VEDPPQIGPHHAPAMIRSIVERRIKSELDVARWLKGEMVRMDEGGGYSTVAVPFPSRGSLVPTHRRFVPATS